MKGLDISFSSPAQSWWQQRYSEGFRIAVVNVWTGGFASNDGLKAVAETNLRNARLAGFRVAAYANASPPDWWPLVTQMTHIRANMGGEWDRVEDVVIDVEIPGITKARVMELADGLEAVGKIADVLYCVTPSTKVLTDSLEWVSAGDIDVGTRLIGFDEHSPGRFRHRRYQSAHVTAYERRQEEVYEIELGSGQVLTSTLEHQWLVAQADGGHGKPVRWMTVAAMAETRAPKLRLVRYLHPWRTASDFNAGYLAAAFDGEGCVSAQNGRAPRVQFAQRDNRMLQRVESLLAADGWQYHKSQASSGGWNLGLHGGQAGVLRFLGQYRPVRLLDVWKERHAQSKTELRAIAFEPIVGIRRVGIREIAAFSSSTATYFAEGFAAHNTGRWFWVGHMNNTKDAAWRRFRLWSAHYDWNPDIDFGDNPYGPWTDVIGEQYQGSTNVAGGTIDLNTFKDSWMAPTLEPEPPEPEEEEMTDAEKAAFAALVGRVDALEDNRPRFVKKAGNNTQYLLAGGLLVSVRSLAMKGRLRKLGYADKLETLPDDDPVWKSPRLEF